MLRWKGYMARWRNKGNWSGAPIWEGLKRGWRGKMCLFAKGVGPLQNDNANEIKKNTKNLKPKKLLDSQAFRSLQGPGMAEGGLLFANVKQHPLLGICSACFKSIRELHSIEGAGMAKRGSVVSECRKKKSAACHLHLSWARKKKSSISELKNICLAEYFPARFECEEKV